MTVTFAMAAEYVKAMRAGRRWAATHPEAEPETYQAKAAKMAPERAKAWLEGVGREYWTPTLDECGRKLPHYPE